MKTSTIATQEDERKRLEELLMVPISRLNISNFFCEIYYEDDFIGYLPIVMSANGITYQGDTSNLQKLDWNKLCLLNISNLTSAVAREVNKPAFKIVPSSFRRIFIEDGENNLFASFECFYKNQGWILVNERILSTE
jgi:hypothetical protein